MTDTPSAARILATGQIVAARLAMGFDGLLSNLITDVRKAALRHSGLEFTKTLLSANRSQRLTGPRHDQR